MIRRAAAIVALALLGAGCGGATPSAETARRERAKEAAAARPYPDALADWGTYHSLRYRMTIPLPNPRAWTYDDHSRAELVAKDAATRSTLTILSENEPTLVNHQLCEARARTLGLVPERGLQSIEDTVTVGPEAYDTRIQVEVERGAAGDGKLIGHVFAFGAYVDKCFVLHLATEVRSEEDEQALSQRLALGRFRLLGGIKVDELGSVPRRKPPL